MSNNTERHFYATSAFGWATAETRHQAIRKLVKDQYSELKRPFDRMIERGELGPYIWSCEVTLPSDAEYSIEFYKPIDVPIRNGCHHYLAKITKAAISYQSFIDEPKEANLTKLDEE